MIAYIEGRLLGTLETSCLVLTPGGVGYEVYLTSPMLARLPEKGSEVCFYVSTIVREDALDLYGFATLEERMTFNILLSISKLGPKTGLATLSCFSTDDLRRIIANEDVSALTQISGVGKKTAQHIFLELKYKLKADTVPGAASSVQDVAQNAFRDALAGLTNLGYAEEEARPALEKIFQEEPDLDVAQALRLALKEMAQQR